MKKTFIKRLQIFAVLFAFVLMFCACGKKENNQATVSTEENITENTEQEEVQPEEPVEEPEIKTKKVKRIAAEKESDGAEYEYKYDEEGNLVEKSLFGKDATYKYEYNDKKLLSREMRLDDYFDNPLFYDEMEMSYDTMLEEGEFDVSDDQREMLDNGYTRYTDYEYDENGNKITEIDYVIDVYSFLFPISYEISNCHRYEYNSDGSLSKIIWCGRDPENPAWDYILVYDENGNNTGLQIATSDDGEISREIVYELDDNGNVLSGYDLDEFRDCTYTYDKDGNILTKTSDQYDFYEAFEDEKAFSYYNLDTYEYEDGLLVSHRYQMVPIGDVDPDYEYYVKDETTTYVYEEIEVEISDDEDAIN
ncbi:MAG: hypothetical protein Q4D29_03855 [Lachnospiraceae bacterium]|nr:hypothetical protein [Lachnospiraceae bacterium]